MYAFEIIDSYDAFRGLAGEWNETLSRSLLDVPYLRHEWFEAWWKTYGPKNVLAAVIAREQGRIAAIAPFRKGMMKIAGLPARAISFMDQSHAPRMNMIFVKEDPALAAQLLEHVHAKGGRYDLMLLSGLEKNSPTHRLLRSALAQGGFQVREIDEDISPYIPIVGTWDEYLKSRSQKFRYQLNRAARVFEKQGYEIAKYSSPADLPRALDELLTVSRASWKYAAGTAIASTADKIRFYAELARSGTANGWLSVWMLKTKGKPVAFQYLLDYRNRMYGLKMEFDNAYRNLAPGKFLARELIKYCFEHGYEEFDMMGKVEPHKMEWSTSCRPHGKYMVFNTSLYGKLLHFFETKAVPLLKRRSGPPLVPDYAD